MARAERRGLEGGGREGWRRAGEKGNGGRRERTIIAAGGSNGGR